MDPLTQGVLGAMAAQSVSQRTQLVLAAVFGALAGMAADLDVLIRSSQDPLLVLEFHRQFTHSLFFIPIGGAVCAALFWLVFGKHRGIKFKNIFVWSTLGYATHGLLDGCTSYGTQLFWPLSNARYSFDYISVIDPMFTLPALVCVLISIFKKQHFWVFIAIAWCAIYMSLGAFQHHRAIKIGHEQAEKRGHVIERLEAKPSFANISVWKVVYETQDQFYVFAVRPGWKETKVWEGDGVQKLDVNRDFPWLDPDSQQAKDISRFTWFSSGFVALDKDHSNRIVDMRYSLLPDQIKPLWWIELSPNASKESHVRFDSEHGDKKKSSSVLWEMIKG